MNWFTSHFLTTILDPNGAWYTLGYDTEFLLYILVFTILALLVRPTLTFKCWLGVAFAAVIVSFLDLVPQMPLYSLVDSPRLKTLSGDAILYMVFMLLGLVSFMVFVDKRRKPIAGLASSLSLMVIMGLGYGYHVVMINGGLKVQLMMLEDRVSYANTVGWEERERFCERMELICGETAKNEQPNTGFVEVDRQLADYVGFYRSKLPEFGFTHSQALITTDQPFAVAYNEDRTGARWALDLKGARLSFDVFRIQFFIFMNLATLFWTLLPGIVVGAHHLMIMRRKKSRMKRDLTEETSD